MKTPHAPLPHEFTQRLQPDAVVAAAVEDAAPKEEEAPKKEEAPPGGEPMHSFKTSCSVNLW